MNDNITTQTGDTKGSPAEERILASLSAAKLSMEEVITFLTPHTTGQSDATSVKNLLTALIAEMPAVLGEYVDFVLKRTEFLRDLAKDNFTVAGGGMLYLKSTGKALEGIQAGSILTDYLLSSLRDREAELTKDEVTVKGHLESAMNNMEDAARLIRKEQRAARDIMRSEGVPTVLMDAALTHEHYFRMLLKSSYLVKKEFRHLT